MKCERRDWCTSKKPYYKMAETKINGEVFRDKAFFNEGGSLNSQSIETRN